MKKKKNCYNCQFAGDPFKIENLTHVYCKYPKDQQVGEENVLDTLQEFWNTCEDFTPIMPGRETDNSIQPKKSEL